MYIYIYIYIYVYTCRHRCIHGRLGDALLLGVEDGVREREAALGVRVVDLDRGA